MSSAPPRVDELVERRVGRLRRTSEIACRPSIHQGHHELGDSYLGQRSSSTRGSSCSMAGAHRRPTSFLIPSQFWATYPTGPFLTAFGPFWTRSRLRGPRRDGSADSVYGGDRAGIGDQPHVATDRRRRRQHRQRSAFSFEFAFEGFGSSIARSTNICCRSGLVIHRPLAHRWAEPHHLPDTQCPGDSNPTPVSNGF